VQPSPVPSPPTVPTACRTDLPPQWRTALDDATLATQGRSTRILSIAPDGSVLAVQDDGPAPGAGRFLVRLGADYSYDVILNIPDPDNQTVAFAQQYEHWVVVGLKQEHRPAKGTIPGSEPLGLSKIEVMDLAGHAAPVTLYPPDQPRGVGPVNSAALFEGRVYWDVRGGYAATRGEVMSYDIATGATTTVYTGEIAYTEVTANGLGLSLGGGEHRVIVPAELPAQVEEAVRGIERDRLTTDGVAYAWMVSPKIVGWWAPGQSEPVYRELPKALYEEDNGGAPLVAGRFVITVSLGASFILTDMRSGAAAPLPARAGTVLRPDFYLSSHGAFAGLGFTEAEGHYIDGYWADAATTVLRVDTSDLPPLTC